MLAETLSAQERLTASIADLLKELAGHDGQAPALDNAVRERWATRHEVAEMTSLSLSTIDNYANRPAGDPALLPSKRIGPRRLFWVPDVHA